MSDTAPTEKEKKSSKKNTPLGKIETAKIEVDNLEKVEEVPVFVSKEQSDIREKSLITAVRNLLKEFGIRKSAAAIRNAVEMPHDEFMPQHAVSALSVLGFKASFGNISIKKLEKDFSVKSNKKKLIHYNDSLPLFESYGINNPINSLTEENIYLK